MCVCVCARMCVCVCVCHMNLYHEAVGCEDLDSVHAAQNCVRWQAILKTVITMRLHRKRGISWAPCRVCIFINFLLRFLLYKISIDYDTVRHITTVTGTLTVLFAEFNAFLAVTECWNLNKEFDSPRFIILLSIVKIRNWRMIYIMCVCVCVWERERVCVCFISVVQFQLLTL